MAIYQVSIDESTEVAVEATSPKLAALKEIRVSSHGDVDGAAITVRNSAGKMFKYESYAVVTVAWKIT